MSFAFSAFCALLLLLPGFLLSRTYYAEIFSRNYTDFSVLGVFLRGLIPNLFLHILWLGMGNVLFDLHPDYQLWGYLLLGPNNQDITDLLAANFEAQMGPILGYFLSIFAISIVIGAGSRALVRHFKLDRRFKFLRFSNEWHYLLTGEILDFPGIDGHTEEADLRFIDALVETQEGTIIYSGILEYYGLGKGNTLDFICLKETYRRFLRDDQDRIEPVSGDPYYHLPGKYFVIPFSQILNMHISYYRIEGGETTPAEAPQTP